LAEDAGAEDFPVRAAKKSYSSHDCELGEFYGKRITLIASVN
jgi:hypothetical protein